MTVSTLDDESSASGSPSVDDIPEVELPEVRIVGHSSLLYWWPVWVVSLALGVYSLAAGDSVVIDADGAESVIPSSTVGVVFVATMLAVIGFTSVKLRGLASVTVLLVLALVALSLAYFGLWDEVVQAIPEMSVHMNAGFYFIFGGGLAAMWLLQFFVFDRLVYYRIRPGQMIEERVIGGGEKSYDTHGMLFEQRDDDFFRHRILGLGAGDIRLVTNDARNETISLENVLFVERRVNEIQRLINVKPDQLAG